MSSQYKNITFQQKIMLQKCFITYTTDIMKAAGCFVQKRQVRQSEMWHNLQGTQQNVPANFLINCTKRTRDYYCCFFKAKGCHTKYWISFVYYCLPLLVVYFNTECLISLLLKASLHVPDFCTVLYKHNIFLHETDQIHLIITGGGAETWKGNITRLSFNVFMVTMKNQQPFRGK